MSKSSKGANWERETCKLLSEWWTKGERQDIFWRTAGSGAMAKTRSKVNQKAFGQYGDLQATDPIGQPLIDLCTIELKRGYSYYTYADLLDKKEDSAIQMYESFINQAQQDCKNAGTPYWMLFTKRDRREALIGMPWGLYQLFQTYLKKAPYCRLRYSPKKIIYITTLNFFLKAVTADNIVNLLNSLKQDDRKDDSHG